MIMVSEEIAYVEGYDAAFVPGSKCPYHYPELVCAWESGREEHWEAHLEAMPIGLPC